MTEKALLKIFSETEGFIKFHLETSLDQVIGLASALAGKQDDLGFVSVTQNTFLRDDGTFVAVPLVGHGHDTSEIGVSTTIKAILDLGKPAAGGYIPYVSTDGVSNHTASFKKIINDLTTGGVSDVLSAQQGVELKSLIDTINALLLSDTETLDTLQEVVDYIETNRDTLDTLDISNITGLEPALNNKMNAVASRWVGIKDGSGDDCYLEWSDTNETHFTHSFGAVLTGYGDKIAQDVLFKIGGIVAEWGIEVGGQNVILENDSRLTNARPADGGTSLNSKYLNIVDIRSLEDLDSNFELTPDDLTDNSMSLHFAYVSNAGSSWRSVLSMKGWSDNYTVWQLIGPSTTTADEELFFRTGTGTNWNTPRRIFHEGHKPQFSEVEGSVDHTQLPYAKASQRGAVRIELVGDTLKIYTE